MSAPIRSDPSHRAAEFARDAQAGTEHTGQTIATRGFMRVKVQHTKMQRARMQHNQMLSAAFYRGKRFAEGNHKPPPPSAQKLMRQLGERPRPGGSAKERGKEGALHERPDLGHGAEQKRDHEHDREHKHEEGQQKKRDQERERDHGEQQHRNGHGREQSQQHEQEQSGGQSQGNGSRDDQSKREGRDSRERRDKPHKFAIGKAARAKAAARKQPLASAMQALARQKLGAPDLPSELAAACTREVLRLTAQLDLGPLLAVPLLLSMTSPMVLKRNAARLHAHRGAALAQSTATPDKAAATAGLIGVSLDNTLARQSAGIQYADADQSIAMVKQRILDALAAQRGTTGAGADGATRTAATASDKTLEVRTKPATPGAKT